MYSNLNGTSIPLALGLSSTPMIVHPHSPASIIYIIPP
jgi:hypothetical protein